MYPDIFKSATFFQIQRFSRAHVAYLNRVRIHSSTQGSSTLKCLQSMRHRARESGGKAALCPVGLHAVPPYWFIVLRLDAGDHATNNLTAWLVIVGSLGQEMLVPDVTLSVIKPN